jgi:Thrombospondin type 3 repeat
MVRSRFWRGGGIGFTAILCVSLLSAAPAAADPCALNLVDSGEFEWDVQADGAVGDGRHIPSGRDDAYDGFGRLYVSADDGVSYNAYANPDALGCTYEADGREVVFPGDTATVAGLELRRKLFVPASGLPFARWIDALTNTGATATTLRVRWGGDLGSDGNTRPSGTSSGDIGIDAADRWAATSDPDDPSFENADPDIAHNWGTTFAGAADVADVAGPFSPGSPGNAVSEGQLAAEYRDVVVAPGETVAYMHAGALRITEPDAVAAARELGLEPDALDAGISLAEAAQIRNWNVGDRERDGIVNAGDNCAATHNPDQADLDGDGQGDACDDDIDGDGRPNAIEQAVGTNPRSADTDGDGVRDPQDACPTISGRGADGCRRFDDQLSGDSTALQVSPALRVRLARVPRRVARRALLRRGISFRARCNRPCKLKVELIGWTRRPRAARAGDRVFGAHWLRRRSDGSRRVRVMVARRHRRAFVRRTRVRLRVTAIDRRGNRRVARRIIRIR